MKIFDYWRRPDLVQPVRDGYVFDRRLFRGGLLVILLFVVVIIAVYGVSGTGGFFGPRPNYYVHCPVNHPGGACLNPLYADDPFLCTEYGLPCDRACVIAPDICHQQFLAPGESHGAPDRVLGESLMFMISVLVVVLAVNHWVNNRGFKR